MTTQTTGAAELPEALPRYREYMHLRTTGAWSDGVPAWAKDYSGLMNDMTAAHAVIEELHAQVEALGAAQAGVQWQCGQQANGFTAAPAAGVVRVCPECDIAGCRHLRAASPTAQAAPDERAAFEARFPVPGGVSWSGSGYVVEDDYINSYRCDRFIGQWAAWQARASHGQAPAQPAPAYKDSTPELHIGDSAFESWYSSYNPMHKGDKQRARDAYAAGMGDSLVMAAPAAVAGPCLQRLHDLLYTAQRTTGDAQAQSIAEARIALSDLMTAPQHVLATRAWPKVSGVCRDEGHPRALLVFFASEPTDDEMRAVHGTLATTPQTTQALAMGRVPLPEKQIEAMWQALASDPRSKQFSPMNLFAAGVAMAEAVHNINQGGQHGANT